MAIIKDKSFDEERALYNSDSIEAINCKFDGPKDGESAFKESKNIVVKNCFFNLRYPFWHDNNVEMNECQMTDKCRAALWYSNDIKVNNSKLDGIKVFRECKDIKINNSEINSPEAFWDCENVEINNSKIDSMYFLSRTNNIKADNLTFTGKYSFQYTNNLRIENSNLDTKDAFWHSDNTIVKNSTIKGEYLGWYSKNLTLDNCTIIGTQPLCYCENLKIINCKFVDADLAFEYSSVEADVIGDIKSIKNPLSGYINADKIDEIILKDSKYPCTCKINTKN